MKPHSTELWAENACAASRRKKELSFAYVDILHHLSLRFSITNRSSYSYVLQQSTFCTIALEIGEVCKPWLTGLDTVKSL